MSPAQRYASIMIGAGQGAPPLATALARAGRKTALIEREHVGSTCTNEGCTPTKTMVDSARVAYLDRRSQDYGVQNGPVNVDILKVRQRKRDNIVDLFRNGSEKGTEGLVLLMGEACFTGPKELEVSLNGGETTQLTADNIFINVGARPADPPIKGLDSVPSLNSTSVVELNEVPEHLLVAIGRAPNTDSPGAWKRPSSRPTHGASWK